MVFTAFLPQKCLKFFSPWPSLRSGLGIVKNISRGWSAWKKTTFFSLLKPRNLVVFPKNLSDVFSTISRFTYFPIFPFFKPQFFSTLLSNPDWPNLTGFWTQYFSFFSLFFIFLFFNFIHISEWTENSRNWQGFHSFCDPKMPKIFLVRHHFFFWLWCFFKAFMTPKCIFLFISLSALQTFFTLFHIF